MAKAKKIKLELTIEEAAVLAEAAITFRETREVFVEKSPKNFHPMKTKYQNKLDKLGQKLYAKVGEQAAEAVWDYDSANKLH